MNYYRVTIDEHTATHVLQRVANWQPVRGLDTVVERLATYCQVWKQGTPPTVAEIEHLLLPEQQHLNEGGPQLPGFSEARFTLYPYGLADEVVHTISIIDLGQNVVTPLP